MITNGYGAMPDYSAQLAPEDRWAVVAYIRALQLSQNATQADVPAGEHVAAAVGDCGAAKGLPATFAEEWGLPPTAVTGTPNGGLYVHSAVETWARLRRTSAAGRRGSGNEPDQHGLSRAAEHT